MIVKQLKEILNGLDDNCEVLLWNGIISEAIPMSDDYVKTQQFQYSPAFYVGELKEQKSELLNTADSSKYVEIMNDIIEKANKYSNESEYEFQNKYFNKDMVDRYYCNPKDVIILQAQNMNKTYSDRLGTIEY